RASASTSGLVILEVRGSRHWVSASIPDWAVTWGGQVTVSAGSTMATRASIDGERSDTFTRCTGEDSTALAVTSDPVPAVVGTATNGREVAGSLWPAPMTSA